MNRRTLNLPDLDAALAEARALHTDGYQQAGEWDLTQVCKHCVMPIHAAIDGFGFTAPAPIRLMIKLTGAKKKLFRNREIQAGLPAPRAAVPEPTEGDREQEAGAIDGLATAIERLKSHTGPLHPNPFLGRLTRDEWLEFHTIHIAHHLRFLIPNEPANATD